MKTRELVLSMHNLFPDISESLDMLQRGFLYDNLMSVENGNAKLLKLVNESKDISKEVSDESQKDNSAVLYRPVPAHLENIVAYCLDIASTLLAKIKDGTLFSDRATNEINYLFEKTKDIIANTGDYVLARNTIVAGYIRESGVSLARSADDFSTKHEERLIEGICTPKASALFLKMIDSFKGIARQSRELAADLAK